MAIDRPQRRPQHRPQRRPQPDRRPERGVSRSRPLHNLLAALMLAAIIVPVGEVPWLRFLPPPATWLAIERFAAEGQGYQRHWRPLAKISPNLVYAVIAAEDDGFCRHHGFDWQGVRAAMRWNARHQGRVRGGSTISQQTAKNVFLWPGRGFVRKGLEAVYTVLIEQIWGKRRIMEVYLNQIEWAPGVYGAQAAAQYWFHTDADRLTSAEAARLAAILPKPLKWRAASAGPLVRRRIAGMRPNLAAVRGGGLAGCVLRS